MKCREYAPKVPEGAVLEQCPSTLKDPEGKLIPLQCSKFKDHTGLHEAAGRRWV